MSAVLRAWSVPLVLVLSIPAAAEVRFTERQATYAVTGDSGRELRDQMNRLGRRSRNGNSYDGNTTSDLKWQFTYRTTSDDCRIGSALVTVDVTYRLPEWTGSDHAPRDLRERWEAFLDRLAAHERTHGRHARDAGEELERALLATPAARFCEDVGRSANERANEVVRALQRTDDDYDARTKHGAAEGVAFP